MKLETVNNFVVNRSRIYMLAETADSRRSRELECLDGINKIEGKKR